MPGPAPKVASARRRQNMVATTRTLAAEAPLATPVLPERWDGVGWHPAAVDLWESLWSSPMRSEYLRVDLQGLLRYVDLVHVYWSMGWEKPTPKILLASEIRLQGGRFGLSPMDRRSLQWSVEQVEQAQDAGKKRRAARVTGKDPRLLHAVEGVQRG